VSVYLVAGRGRGGEGRALYEALFDRLAARDHRTVMAAMTVPNEASASFHRAMGFTEVGLLRRVGWKHGAWRDVAWVQREIGPGTTVPPSDPD
jgi:phosphinothricin acetyltransferase